MSQVKPCACLSVIAVVIGCAGGSEPSSPPGAGGSQLAGSPAAGGSSTAGGGGAGTAGTTANGAAANGASPHGGAGANGEGLNGGSAGTSSGSSNGGGSNGGSAGANGGGSNGGNAGANGGGSNGGGGTAGAASCVTGGGELCDGFESGQIDPARWKLTKPTSSATITVDSQHVHSGQHAVHIRVIAGQQSTAMLTESVTFPAFANSFYARAFFYFAPDLPEAPGGDFHMGFIFGIGQNDAGDVQAGMGMIGGERQYLGYSIFFGPPKYEFGPWSEAKVQPNQWQCIELFEDGSNPNEEKRQVWLDGTELTDLRSTSNNQGAPANHKPPAFDGVSFGLWEYHPSPLLSDLWLDDIRVSKSRIGCTTP